MTFRGKTGTRTVPLSDAAAVLFTRLSKSKLRAAPLFTRDGGRPWAHGDWDKLIREAASIARLPEGCCLYTLRHSFITEAISQGLTTLDVARLCGTSVLMIEKHYGLWSPKRPGIGWRASRFCNERCYRLWGANVPEIPQFSPVFAYRDRVNSALEILRCTRS